MQEGLRALLAEIKEGEAPLTPGREMPKDLGSQSDSGNDSDANGTEE